MYCAWTGAGAAAAVSNAADNTASCFDNQKTQIPIYAVARRKNNAELDSFDMSMLRFFSATYFP